MPDSLPGARVSSGRAAQASIPLIELDDTRRKYVIGLETEVLSDPTHRLSLQQVASGRYDSLFRRNTRRIPNFGYSSADYWFRFRVRNAARRDHTYWLLEIGYPLTDLVEMYILQPDGSYQVKKTGELVPFSEREIQYQNFVMGLDLFDNGERTVYLHFAGKDSKQFPLYIWEGQHFFETSHQQDLIWGLYFGTLLVMILYNLFLYFSIRYITYLYYVLYITGFLLIQLCLSGYAYQYLWPSWPWFAHTSNLIFVGLTLFFCICFTISMLNVRQTLPRAFPILAGIAGAGLAVAVICFFELIRYPTRLVALFTILASATLFTVAILILRKGYRPARYYLIAWTSLLLAMIIYIAKNAALLPNNVLTEHAIQLGSAMEVILLSLGLGDNINSMKKEREKAQLEVIVALQETERVKDAITRELEQKVIQRTAEIRKQKEELEVLNATKDKFFSIVAHDLRGPLNSMTGFFDLLANHTEALSAEQIQSIARNLGQSVENTTRLTDNLLTWAMAQMNTLKHHPQDIYLDRLIRETVLLFQDQARRKHIALYEEIEPDLLVHADENHLRFVVRNLISNAIKFTAPGGHIRVDAGICNARVEVSITDTGVGMSEEVLNQIFRIDSKHTSEGTAGEKGTGLGLLLCREFLERNGGRLRATSQPRKGSTFTFALELILMGKQDVELNH